MWSEERVARLMEPKCPGCGAPRVPKFRPFCSRRCADADLGRWFTGAYAIPTAEIPDEFDLPGDMPGGMSDDDRDDL